MGGYDFIREIDIIIEVSKKNPYRDPKTGRYTFAHGGKDVTGGKKRGKIKGNKDASRRPTLRLPKDEYAMVVSELNTHMTADERKESVVAKTIGLYTYMFENHGFGEYRFIDKWSAEED